MHRSTKQLIALGVLAEAGIWVVSYLLTDSFNETFRLAARFSGRLSAFVFLITFYQYARSFRAPESGGVQPLITLFAVLHAIHWGFLATNVYLNDLPLETTKLIGGGLAYAMIVLAPFRLLRLKRGLQLVYFYYVTLVMSLTYLARIKGEFEGVEPNALHYTMLGLFAFGVVVFSIIMFRNRK